MSQFEIGNQWRLKSWICILFLKELMSKCGIKRVKYVLSLSSMSRLKFSNNWHWNSMSDKTFIRYGLGLLNKDHTFYEVKLFIDFTCIAILAHPSSNTSRLALSIFSKAQTIVFIPASSTGFCTVQSKCSVDASCSEQQYICRWRSFISSSLPSLWRDLASFLSRNCILSIYEKISCVRRTILYTTKIY